MLHPFISTARPRHDVSRATILSAALHVVFVSAMLTPKPARLTSEARGIRQTIHYTDLGYTPFAREHPNVGDRSVRAAAPRRHQAVRTPEHLALDALDQVAVPEVAVLEISDSLVRGAGIDPGLAMDPPNKGNAQALSENVAGETYVAATVESNASPLPENPKPPYPADLLRQAQEASFSVFFVVDTSGKIDENTIDVPPSVREQFARSVRSVLGRWHFFPAQRHGQRVRQLMEQAFTFRIEMGRRESP